MMFNPKTPVLDYSPRSQQRSRKYQYLLCPVLSYRIVAPKITSRKLNILEKAILNLCRIGHYTADEIGKILEIDPQLAALILFQLKENKGCIDKQGNLTQKGEETLKGIIFTEAEMMGGYIFQNPLTGELYPRFLETLIRAEVKMNKGGFPDLVKGTTGNPYYERAFMPLPLNNIYISQPSSKEILRAIEIHNKHCKHQDSELDRDYSLSNKTLEKVSFIEEEPTPFWVATFVYIPEKQTEEEDWYICDPFGLGDSIWLRDRVQKQIKKAQPESLTRWFSDFLHESKTTSENNKDQFSYYQLKEDAEFLVEERLTLGIKQYDNVFNALVIMEASHLEIDQFQEKIPPDKLDDVMIKAQKVAESLLVETGKNYPTHGNCNLLIERDRAHNRQLIQELATTLNFNQDLPRSLTDVQAGKIKHAAEKGEGSLRPLLLANLFTASKQVSHPLQNVATHNPNLLIELDTLAKLRDQSSHYTQTSLTRDQVSNAVQTIYQFVSLTLGLPLNH